MIDANNSQQQIIMTIEDKKKRYEKTIRFILHVSNVYFLKSHSDNILCKTHCESYNINFLHFVCDTELFPKCDDF